MSIVCILIMQSTQTKIYRVIDANLNRAREGLRVCEEVVRFVLDDARLTRRLKHLRHRITDILKKFSPALLKARNSNSDVGRNKVKDKESRSGYRDLFLANMERVKESVRVLEEFSKLVDEEIRGKASNTTSSSFKRIRFRLYTLEKEIIEKFPALSNRG